jgi:hypothetical protein
VFASTRIVPPPIAYAPYTRNVDMPDRPWWRRYRHRQIDT